MQLKVYCPCGAKFSFDVEPSGGRMPVSIDCPVCGEDATELANCVLEKQLGPTQTAQPTLAPTLPTLPASAQPVVEPPAPSGSHAPRNPRVRVRQRPAPQPDDAPTGAAVCLKHSGRRAVDTCRVCGKPICRNCMVLFGYVCSPFCKSKAEAEGIRLPQYAHQHSVVQRKARNRTRLILAAATCGVLLLIAFGVYYKAYASKPHVIHSQAITSSEYEVGTCKLLDDDTYLSIAGGTLSLHQMESGEARWTVPLGGDTGDSDFPRWTNTKLLNHARDVWIRSGDRVLCYGRDTGALKHEIAIEGYVEKHRATDDAVTFLTSGSGSFAGAGRAVTQISFADGTVTTNPIPVTGRSAAAIPSYILTGPNVVELEVSLIEQRTIVREAIKTPKESIVDSGNVSGANSMVAAEQLLNEISRTVTGGKEYEDASRYGVTLRRHLEPNATDWVGEVVGQVQFHPMQTVDLIVAGKSLRVFDKQNNLKWQAALTYPVSDPFGGLGLGRDTAPAIEAGARLFFFDQGMLTAFDLATGNPQWRVTSVGITRVHHDADGDLYLCTSTANAEDIEYSQQIKVMDKPRAVLMKVDGETGKVLWQTTMAGDDCILTGKYVYSTTSKIDFTAMLNPDNDDVHFRVFRIDPSNGKRLWTYYQPQKAVEMDFRDNTLLFQFPDRIEVLRYAAL